MSCLFHYWLLLILSFLPMVPHAYDGRFGVRILQPSDLQILDHEVRDVAFAFETYGDIPVVDASAL